MPTGRGLDSVGVAHPAGSFRPCRNRLREIDVHSFETRPSRCHVLSDPEWDGAFHHPGTDTCVSLARCRPIRLGSARPVRRTSSAGDRSDRAGHGIPVGRGSCPRPDPPGSPDRRRNPVPTTFRTEDSCRRGLRPRSPGRSGPPAGCSSGLGRPASCPAGGRLDRLCEGGDDHARRCGPACVVGSPTSRHRGKVSLAPVNPPGMGTPERVRPR